MFLYVSCMTKFWSITKLFDHFSKMVRNYNYDSSFWKWKCLNCWARPKTPPHPSQKKNIKRETKKLKLSSKRNCTKPKHRRPHSRFRLLGGIFSLKHLNTFNDKVHTSGIQHREKKCSPAFKSFTVDFDVAASNLQ